MKAIDEFEGNVNRWTEEQISKILTFGLLPTVSSQSGFGTITWKKT